MYTATATGQPDMFDTPVDPATTLYDYYQSRMISPAHDSAYLYKQETRHIWRAFPELEERVDTYAESINRAYEQRQKEWNNA